VTVALAAGLVALMVANSALTIVKPKPWQWRPEKVVARLSAATPIMGGEIGSEILSARCMGQGRGVAGRFSRFTCETRWGSLRTQINASTLTIRILPVGSGKLCVVTTTGTQGVPVGVPVAVPYTPGASWTPIRPERACP
jgi:hypothetical protein